MSEHEHAHHEQPDEHGQAEAQDDGFTIWSVHRRGGPAANGGRAPLEKELAALEAEGIIARGVYDLSGMRADADIMVWLHGTAGTRPEALQAAMRRVRRSRELAGTTLVWSAMGVHRDAEFNKQHVPGFMRGIAPKRWVTVYPFNRSYDWYLLPAEDRSRMLAEHGRAGAAYRGVLANTVSAFALGDYEWILAFEAAELHRIVDLMRDLRPVGARRHVREEIPFYTGPRVALVEWAERQPRA